MRPLWYAIYRRVARALLWHVMQASGLQGTQSAKGGDSMTEYITIYKTDEFTAQIVTDEGGVVLDFEIIFKPSSEFMRRIRRKFYKQPLRVELPEDNFSNASLAAGAWLL
jgi:hypothetical protein